MASFNTYLFIYVVGGLTFLPLCVACVFFILYLSFPTVPVPHDYTVPRIRPRKGASLGSYDSDATRRPRSQDGEIDGEGGDTHDAHDRDGRYNESNRFSIRSADEQLAAQDYVEVAAAGYFSVYREYVPGAGHAKLPSEKNSPTGESSHSAHSSNGTGASYGEKDKDKNSGNGHGNGSTSVYQSMYRSLFSFEGKKHQSHSATSSGHDSSSSTSLSSLNSGNSGNGNSSSGKGPKRKNVFYVVLR